MKNLYLFSTKIISLISILNLMLIGRSLKIVMNQPLYGRKKIPFLYSFFLLLLFSSYSNAQITVGPGIVNRYYPVTAITAGTGTCNPAGSPAFTLGAFFGTGPAVSAIPLMEGNKVLIIQMMAGSSGTINSGASYKYRSPQSSAGVCTYGDVVTLGHAGNYEYALISSISGSVITFTKALLNTYEVNGKVQVIPVAGYSTSGTNVVTSGIITPLTWNQTNGVGGVVAIESNGGTLTINGDINASGMGYAGGPKRTDHQYGRCCNTSEISAAKRFACYYDETTGASGWCNDPFELSFGAPKGSGIFGVFPGETLGYAHIANGAGGGGGHNSGGGGGGGTAGGGNGGYEYEGCGAAITDDIGGRGGTGFPGNGSKIFMGGGGGSGLGNETPPEHTAGANGGGIIMLKATQLIVPAATNITLNASGAAALTASVPGRADAAGGGGGGGTVLIALSTGWNLTGTLTINTAGGKGGDNNSGNCHGVGGGGGSGRIEVPSTNPNLSFNTNGGVRGTHLAIGWCGTWGAGNGNSSLPVTTGVTLNQNNCGALQVNFLSFYGEQKDKNIELFWYTDQEINSKWFEIERSFDGINFAVVGRVQAAGNSSGIRSYSFNDLDALESSIVLYYRIKEIDLDESIYYSRTIALTFERKILDVVHSNPVSGNNFAVTVNYFSSLNEDGWVDVLLMDALGKEVFSGKYPIVTGTNELDVNIRNIGTGFYLLRIKEGMSISTSKLVIE